jgi:3-methyladenine DNA glycosylase AlkD
MKAQIADQVGPVIAAYTPTTPRATADNLRTLWLQFETKSVVTIKAAQRKQQETTGVAVPLLRALGKEIAKSARQRVDDFIPLARLLWEDYGREGRVVAVMPLGAMELVAPGTIMPLLMELCRSCVTWEDADHLAMRALEPIVRKKPGEWLGALDAWLSDENKWVRRAGVTVVGRLPMKHPDYAARCLELAARLLPDAETDVKRAVSFAIRLTARGDIPPVRDFLARHVPPQDPRATWVLCDVIRSMTPKFLPEFASLLPRYEQWAADPALSGQDRRSVQSAIKTLRRAQK